jgi:hypothetical protein
MTNDTARILASCLDALEQGQSLEECVGRHPDQRLTLIELLPVAQTLRSAPAVMPSLDFRLDARQHLLASLPPRLPVRHTRRAAWFAKRVTLLRVTVMLLLMVVLATSVVTASAQALPNDVLYPVKRTIEQARLALAADGAHSGELRLAFAAERLKEVERLIEAGRGSEAAVAIDDFTDQIESVVSITQSMPDTTERADLLARVAASFESSNAVLSAAQARLPDSAEAAIARARALLAERVNDLPRAPRPTLPPPAVSATPDRSPQRQRTPALPEVVPTMMPSRPAVWPTLIGRPTAWPTPIERPTSWPTRQSPRATIVPPVNPTYVLPHWPTPAPHATWPFHHR